MVMHYRYFTCIKDNYFTKWEYLSEEEVTTKIVKNDYKSCFQTIESWDEKGTKHCPIYADFDGPTAQRDAYEFAVAFYNLFNAEALIYFSGSKGFHVVLPVDIYGENCEAIVREVVRQLGAWQSLDTGMYKSRNMWRICNTINEKSGLYKIQINKWDLISLLPHEIRFMARNPGKTWEADFSAFDSLCLDSFVVEAKARLATNAHLPYREPRVKEKSWELMATPCIYRMIKEAPEDGSKHNSQVVLARFFKWTGTPEQEAIALLLNQDHFLEHEKHLRQVFASIYGSGKTWGFGCKNCELMQNKCVSSCLYYRRKDELG